MAKTKRSEVLASLRMVGERLSTARLGPADDDEQPISETDAAQRDSVDLPISESIVASLSLVDEPPAAEAEQALSPIEEAERSVPFDGLSTPADADVISADTLSVLEAREELLAAEAQPETTAKAESVAKDEPSSTPVQPFVADATVPDWAAELGIKATGLNGFHSTISPCRNAPESQPARTEKTVADQPVVAEMSAAAEVAETEPVIAQLTDEEFTDEDDTHSTTAIAEAEPISDVPDVTDAKDDAPEHDALEAIRSGRAGGETAKIMESFDEPLTWSKSPIEEESARDPAQMEAAPADRIADKEIVNIWAPELRMPGDPSPVRPKQDVLESYQFSTNSGEDDPVARAMRTIEEFAPANAPTRVPRKMQDVPSKPVETQAAAVAPKEDSADDSTPVDWNFSFDDDPEVTFNWLPRRGVGAALLVLLLVAGACFAVFFFSGTATKKSGPQPKPAPAVKPGGAQAAEKPNAAAEKEIRTNYARLYRARASNPTSYMELLTPDFTFVDRKSKVSDRAATENNVKKSVAFWKSVNSWATEVHSISVEGNQATAEISEEFDNFFRDDQGLYGSKGQRHRFVSKDMEFRDHWVKTDGGWKLARSKAIKAPTETVDGKPVKA